MNDSRNVCGYDGCDEVHHCMGLCRVHYDAAQQMVRRGEVTRQQLLDAGVLKPRFGGRPLRDPQFNAWVKGVVNANAN